MTDDADDPRCLRRLVPAILSAAMLYAPAAAWASTDFQPYAAVDVVDDSNVFGRPAGSPPLAAQGISNYGDLMEVVTAGAKTVVGWSQEQWTLGLEGSHDNYDRFTLLDHNEYKLGTALDWRADQVLSGTLSYDQTHVMAPLIDTFATQLLMNTDKLGQAAFRVLFAPEWRLDLTPRYHELDSPLPGYPDFALDEGAGEAALNFLGISRLSAGLRYEYAEGEFHDIIDATRYHQGTQGITVDYQVTGLSAFTLQAGYTSRDSFLAGPTTASSAAAAELAGVAGRTSGVTGSIGYRREISAKTHIRLDLDRAVQSFVAGANSDVVTGGTAEIDWDPDAMFTVQMRYAAEQDSIRGPLLLEDITGRSDHLQTTSLDIIYHFKRQLDIHPYVSYARRSSTYYLANYSATTIGIEIKGHLPEDGAASD